MDSSVLAMLEAVRTGALDPGMAAMQLRERSAGYQQVRLLQTRLQPDLLRTSSPARC